MKTLVKVYIVKDATITHSHLPLLYPNLGYIEKQKQLFLNNVTKLIPAIFEVVEDPEESDFLLIPYNFYLIKKEHRYIKKYEALSEEYGKKILVFDYSDFHDDIRIKNSLIFRIAVYRRMKKQNEFLVPILVEDLGALREITVREKKEVPVIGFAGWVYLTFWQHLRSLIKELPIRFLGVFDGYYRVYQKGVFWRARAIKVLEKSRGVSTNFLKRGSFSAYAGTAEKDFVTLREEFIDNMMDCDYALIVRGDANASNRFYEALSLGRIPLVVDTDVGLPFEEHIRYEEFCVFVGYRDIDRIDEILLEFHQALTPEQCIEMQKKAREIFADYFRVDAAMRALQDKLFTLRDNST